MKNKLEGFAVFLVGAITLGIVYLIVQYNLIDETNIVTVSDQSTYVTPDNLVSSDDDIDAELDAEIEEK